MSETDTTTNGVSDVEVVERIVPTGELHRIVEITQECYDEVKAISEAAGARGMQDGFEFWLCRLARQHAKVQENLWRKADDVSIFTRAQKGNSQAMLAVLATLGVKGDQAQAFLQSVKAKK